MENVITGYPDVPQSITNPNVRREDALDRTGAFSLIKFIQVVRTSYEPDLLQSYYTHYLNKWSIQNNTTRSDNRELIVERYRDFLKEVSLSYASNAEKKFLSHIDFRDENDLAIAISFFSRKLRDIIEYYRDKRIDLTNSITRNRVRGSVFSLEKRINEFVIDYLKSREDGEIEYNIDQIKNDISIKVDEYFDSYTSYFDQEPDSKSYGLNFKSYDTSDLPTDNIFLVDDDELISEVFADTDDFIRDTLEVDELFENKRALTEKFIGTDFYYISTSPTGDLLYDKLFEADAPYSNFLNQNYPTHASVFANNIETKEEVGYFKPNNTGVSIIQAPAIDFRLTDNYEPDSLYIFPDPNIFTNNQDILIFNIQPTEFVRNMTSGVAKLQPNTSKEDTSYIGYSSKFSVRSEHTDLAFLFDSGFIIDRKSDIYNNIFGLLKDNNAYRENVTDVTTSRIKNLILNGYQFYDTLYGEGYQFDYSTFDNSTYGETIRSGLSTYTNSFTGIDSSDLYYLFFRYFKPYQELIEPTTTVDFLKSDIKTADVADGAFFTKDNTDLLPDPISSDLGELSSTVSQFYYSDLYDGGVAAIAGSTITRALCDAIHPTLIGSFDINIKTPTLNNSYLDIEGGRFTDTLNFDYTPSIKSYYYDNTVLSPTVFEPVSAFDTATGLSSVNIQRNIGKYNIDALPGTIYVRNSYTGAGREIISEVNYLSSKHIPAVVTDLSANVLNFDLFYDTLFIETSSYLVIEPLSYDGSKFKDPLLNNIVLNINTDAFDKVSNRFKRGRDVFYYRLQANTTETDLLSVYPEIYKYSAITKTSSKIYPVNDSILSNDIHLFSLTGQNVVYDKSYSPILTYNENRDVFNIAYLLKDQNNSPLLVSFIADIGANDNVTFIRHDYNRAVFDNKTFTFNTPATLSSFSFNLSSSVPEIANNTLIL